ncbi:MAG: FAD-dependent monooxygenase [Legionellales bacterium]|nr:FAD-dependent monooxygenase [Legionellales bacterium]
MKTNFDIIIVGAGIVGLSCAAMLAQQDLRIAVIDTQPLHPQFNPDNYDLRVSAITLASENIFKHLNIWSTIEKYRLSPFRHMQVWDKTGDIHFSANEIAQPHLGHIIENSVIVKSLLEELQFNGNVSLLTPLQLENLAIFSDHVELTSSEQRKLTAKLIIAADGAHSWVRQQAHIDLTTWGYGQEAIVATIENELPHQQTARQRFLNTGPLAHLPLNKPSVTSIVWSCIPQRADELMQLNDEQFNQELTHAFQQRLGSALSCSERRKFPLVMRHAKCYVKNRLALIGDASHTIHPLAGQGVNLGLLDAACLAEIIITNHQTQRDFASINNLRRYERWRKGHNWLMIAAMEGFKQLFSNDIPGLDFIRNYGLSSINKVGFVKNHIMKSAMGLRGDLPKLAK